MRGVRKLLQPGEIPQAGELLLHFSEILNGSPLPREMRVTAIQKTPVQGKIELTDDKHKTELNPLQMLIRIRDLKTYRGDSYPVSRINSRAASRVGGTALLGIARLIPPEGLTGDALYGITNSVSTVHAKLEHAFRPIARPIETDKEALDTLAELQELLGTRRKT